MIVFYPALRWDNLQETLRQHTLLTCFWLQKFKQVISFMKELRKNVL